jgi:phage terminase large subunit
MAFDASFSLDLVTPAVFEPLLSPSRYKGAWGGRGSGKSHFFAELVIEDALRHPGLRVVCIREVQKTLKESAKRLIEDKIQALGVGAHFECLTTEIRTPSGGVILFQGMQDHTAESIKSLEGVDRAWVEEAQTLSARSLSLLRPTIRKEGSEIWFSWNPRRKIDAVDEFLRGDPPAGATVVQANWRDNPFFPSVLAEERRLDLQRYPDRYEHIWEGGYAKAFEGAYYAAALAQAQREGRICELPTDNLVPVRAFWDIGGAGAKADANAIWVVQFVGSRVHVLDYIEGRGQVVGYYIEELMRRGWERSWQVLPHDGAHFDKVIGKRHSDHLEEAGFKVDTISNQGPGAAAIRIENTRRWFPRIWFNEATTEAGRDALGYYHEKRDDDRGVGLGPEHDWASHAADAFGLMACVYEEPRKAIQPLQVPDFGAV